MKAECPECKSDKVSVKYEDGDTIFRCEKCGHEEKISKAKLLDSNPSKNVPPDSAKPGSSGVNVKLYSCPGIMFCKNIHSPKQLCSAKFQSLHLYNLFPLAVTVTVASVKLMFVGSIA